jgi:hypothetical protein
MISSVKGVPHEIVAADAVELHEILDPNRCRPGGGR